MSAATDAGRARRERKAKAREAKIEWYADEVAKKVDITLRQRVKLATEYLKNKVIKNLSVPVEKIKSPFTGRIIVTARSLPGEFPRADTTNLMKSIFSEQGTEDGQPVGYVGTPVDYGLIHEVTERPFLTRTLNEERDNIVKLLTMPATGAT